jgi:hypothetical protein
LGRGLGNGPTSTQHPLSVRRCLTIALTLIAALTVSATTTLASDSVERKPTCAPFGRVSQESTPAASRDGRTLAWASGLRRRGVENPVQRVWVSKVDGSRARTVSVPGRGNDSVEALAPDGSQVLIYRDTSDSWILASTKRPEWRIIKDAERHELRREWRTSEWSPDGRYRVQAHAEGERLVILPADGGPTREIATPGTGDIQGAAWSPDGRRIVIEAHNEAGADLYVVRPDGSGLRRLTNGANAGAAAWSLDGSLIAYFTDDTDVHSGVSIAVIRPDGSGSKHLAGGLEGPDRRSAYSASWIDARTLVFVSSHYRGGSNHVVDIHTIRRDAGAERRVTYECHLGTRGHDRLSGSMLGDTIRTFAGDDVIGAGPGADDVDAGPGNDSIRTIDRARDNVRCGPGRDSVVADRADRIARDCERVSRRST